MFGRKRTSETKRAFIEREAMIKLRDDRYFNFQKSPSTIKYESERGITRIMNCHGFTQYRFDTQDEVKEFIVTLAEVTFGDDWWKHIKHE